MYYDIFIFFAIFEKKEVIFLHHKKMYIKIIVFICILHNLISLRFYKIKNKKNILNIYINVFINILFDGLIDSI